MHNVLWHKTKHLMSVKHNFMERYTVLYPTTNIYSSVSAVGQNRKDFKMVRGALSSN